MADRGCDYNETKSFIPYTGPEIQARFNAYLVLTILSTFANILVILTFIVEKSLRTTFNIFILNLAIVDLLTSIFRMGFKALIIAAVKGYSWPYSQVMCNFNGVLQSVVYVANVYNLMAIAICRYMAIVLSKRHLVTKKVVYIIIIIIWLYSIMVSLLPVFGWNRYCYQPSQFSCLIDWFHDNSFPTYVMATEFVIPMVILVFCYTGILVNLKRNSYRIRTASCLEDNSNNAMHRIAQREAKVTIGMFIVFLAFVVCLGPYSICMFLLASIFGIRIHRNVIFFCGFMVNFNSLCNPIIYAIWQRRFRIAYCKIMFCCCPKFMQYSFNSSQQGGTGQRLVTSHPSSQNTAPITKDGLKCQEKYQKCFSFIFNDLDYNGQYIF